MAECSDSAVAAGRVTTGGTDHLWRADEAGAQRCQLRLQGMGIVQVTREPSCNLGTLDSGSRARCQDGGHRRNEGQRDRFLVEVRYFSQPDASGPRIDLDVHLLRAERVRLRTRPSADILNFFPSLAEVGGVETFPELAAAKAIWIEVAPVTPGLRIWALMSITNNETQQVTIVTPNT